MGLQMSIFLMNFLNTTSSKLAYTMGMAANFWIILMIAINIILILVNTILECKRRHRLKSTRASNIKKADDLEKELAALRIITRKNMLEEMLGGQGI